MQTFNFIFTAYNKRKHCPWCRETHTNAHAVGTRAKEVGLVQNIQFNFRTIGTLRVHQD